MIVSEREIKREWKRYVRKTGSKQTFNDYKEEFYSVINQFKNYVKI